MYKHDDAVSPVIGVILMVAITVILAAVIAAFVFGMAGNVSKTKTIAVTAAQVDSQLISVTNQGGKDITGLSQFNVSAFDKDGVVVTNYNGNTTCLGTSVGTSCPVTTTGTFDGKEHIVVVGKWDDGTEQVVLDTYV